MAGLPDFNYNNRCDTKSTPKNPAETIINPMHCRTFRAICWISCGAGIAIAAIIWTVMFGDLAPDCVRIADVIDIAGNCR